MEVKVAAFGPVWMVTVSSQSAKSYNFAVFILILSTLAFTQLSNGVLYSTGYLTHTVVTLIPGDRLIVPV